MTDSTPHPDSNADAHPAGDLTRRRLLETATVGGVVWLLPGEALGATPTPRMQIRALRRSIENSEVASRYKTRLRNYLINAEQALLNERPNRARALLHDFNLVLGENGGRHHLKRAL